MHLEALGQEICTGLIVGRISQGEHAACCSCHRFMAGHQLPHYVQGRRIVLGFRDGGQARQGAAAMGGHQAEGSDPFGNFI